MRGEALRIGSRLIDAYTPEEYADEVDEFEWDEEKSERCVHERGFDFTYATQAFDSEGSVEWEDKRATYGEIRYVTVGEVGEYGVSSQRVPHRGERGRHYMAIVRRTKKEIREHLGRVDPVKLASFTEADIERFAREDDSDTSRLGEPRFIPPKTGNAGVNGHRKRRCERAPLTPLHAAG